MPNHQTPTPTEAVGQATAWLYLRVSTKEQAERGGQAEGFSIPAQREAVHRKAEQLGAAITREYADRGESAKTADRDDLQRLLTDLADQPPTYVIVHKLDRLARNRADDIQITLALQAAGVTLISVTENIDQTPSGMLLHGIMSSIAEFYSRNLAAEVIKGTEQKVRAGGTANQAPIGYLNTRLVVDGREQRTVTLDPDRADLIRFAFTAYATGDWTLTRLAHELDTQGLTQRATAKRPARPLDAKKLGLLLHNPYYTGVVTWRGIQHPGRHQPLVTIDTFAQVQAVLAAHRQSGERSYRQRHYLAGTLYCGLCRSKLIYMISRGRSSHYGYWACLGRHNYKNGCPLPYLPEAEIDDQLVQHWQHEQLDAHHTALIRDNLAADLADYTNTTNHTAARLDQRIAAIHRQRRTWADKAITGAVPDDIARNKQTELAHHLATAETQRARLRLTQDQHHTALTNATALLPQCGKAYRCASDTIRRDYNQAWFTAIYISTNQGRPIITDAERTKPFQALYTAHIQTPGRETAPDLDTTANPTDQTTERRTESLENGITEKPGSIRYRVYSHIAGSNIATLVGVTGIEPVTARV